MKPEIDIFDRKIIRVLSEDGRLSWRDLSEKIGLSLTPTIRRVKRLESEGYIDRYTIAVSPRKLVGATNVIISLYLDSHSNKALTEFEEAISCIEEVVYCAHIGSDPDYFVNVAALDNYEYRLLLDRISSLPHVHRVKSHMCLRVIVRRAMLPNFTD